MIDLYYWTTPNGHKVTMFLEEAGLEYNIKTVNISKGEQFDAAFLRISPNNKIPAMVDHAPIDGGKPISVFESGAMLIYLAGKTGQFIPRDLRGQVQALEWVMWQMGGLGPMAGQNHHFANYAPEKIPYAIDRYVKETSRLYAVLDKQLKGKDFILGKQYTIADMASYPWIIPDRQGQDVDQFPNLKRWKAAIRARPATERAYAKAKAINPQAGAPRQVSDEERKILFGQDRSVVK